MSKSQISKELEELYKKIKINSENIARKKEELEKYGCKLCKESVANSMDISYICTHCYITEKIVFTYNRKLNSIDFQEYIDAKIIEKELSN